ncbi:MAG: PHP domain-containing protein [Spirochaetaceae bacterium]
MIQYKKIVVISDIESELADILVQRLVYRMLSYIIPDLIIIIDDENILTNKTLDILNSQPVPFIVVPNINETIYQNLYGFKFPKFSESPFSYVVVDNLVARKIKKYNLVMDKDLNLEDNHMHTQFAYCGENMEISKNIHLAKLFGLKKIIITEHADQLYMNSKNYTDIECYSIGIKHADEIDYRMDEYIDLKNKFSDDFVRFGVEVGVDFNGNLLIKDEDLKHFDFLLGSMHLLEDLTPEVFISILEKLLKKNIDVLAHPFRIFKRNGKELPEMLFKPTAKLLKQYNTAAEINFHTNEPPVAFIKECLKLGVKFSFGSDSHNLAEIGDFSYHINLLKEAGFKGDLQEILWSKK